MPQEKSEQEEEAKEGEEEDTGIWNRLFGGWSKKQVEPSSNPKEENETLEATKTGGGKSRENPFDNVQFSRSGKILTKDNISTMREEQILEMFDGLKIDSEEFAKDPHSILYDPDVLVSIDDAIYTSKDAVAIIISYVCFDQKYEGTNLKTFAVNYEAGEEQKEEKPIVPQLELERFETC